MANRIAIAGLGTLVVILAVVVALLMFGTPQQPSAMPAEGASAAGSASVYPPGADDPAAEVPPPDPAAPLAIQIPGCVCHSDDPKVVEQHSHYRMNQCFGCHAEGTPQMGY